MKKLLQLATAVVTICTAVSSANALTILNTSSTRYIGMIDDGVPVGSIVDYINVLIGLPAPTSPAVQSPPGSGEFYTRSANNWFTLPTATSTGMVVYEDDDDEIDNATANSGTGFNYMTAKYGSGNSGGGTYVFYIGGLIGEDINVPNKFEGNGPGLSNIRMINPGPGGEDRVPDGGTTLALLGLGLTGLGMARARFARK